MALTQRQRNKPMAARCAAQDTPVKVQVQGSLNRKTPIRSNGTNEVGSNSDNISHYHRTRRVALSQRSSLRRALRESLGLLDESVRSTESIGSSPTLPRPQRSSLRRAIRDSLAAINTYGGSRVSRADDTKSNPAHSLSLGLIAAKKLGFETPHQVRATSHAISQRSSLRRAIRESRDATAQSIEPVDTTSHGTSPSQTPTNTIHDPLSGSDDENGSVISPLGSNTSKPLLEEGIPKAPSQMNCTSSAIPCTTYRASLTATAYRQIAISPPQGGSMPELSLLAESPTSKPFLPTSRSLLNHVLAPKVNDESGWRKSTRHPNPHLALPDRGICDNERRLDSPSDSQSMPNSKGWHYVREIISEAPGGLFLVEWEERDARTGFKWPASWVKAKDVSICAIQDWERKK
ncbi:hypothetical protein F4680DRAFT_466152 [Xylaria scruposa]|nr:hypothetical protein F4680DRAFT_466152 [Xylaria scruposa]